VHYVFDTLDIMGIGCMGFSFSHLICLGGSLEGYIDKAPLGLPYGGKDYSPAL